jgi:aminopeptidase N
MISRQLAAVGVLLACAQAAGADTYVRQPGVDVLGYAFAITLSDERDAIVGETTVDVRFTAGGVTVVTLDLAGRRADGKGMTVDAVSVGGQPVPFRHEDDRLIITLAPGPAANERRQFVVRYQGVPASGLQIKPNKYGDRCFFSDNWPDKARQWLPVIDHPYDKAASEFLVTAPSHYQVVANGLLVEETDLGDGTRLTHWKQSVPIAVWLNALGVARFAVQHLGAFEGRPIQTWVYRQDRDAGFHDFAVPTKQVLEFYSDRVGPFSYEKLANVQSNSVGGGMESATAIFYDDDSVSGTRNVRWRNVVIHEIAHQWFGNAVTEADWDDVWLSEGFATYFTLLFVEHAYGRDEFVDGLRRSRDQVRAFDRKTPNYRIVHDQLADMREVTTSQIYQKGGWTLHMLRGLVGDEVFWAAIRDYYARYRDGNATTADFRRAVEERSRQNLGWFFDQWLYRRGGMPAVSATWRYDEARKVVEIEFRQTQASDPFRVALDVGLSFGGESGLTLQRVQVDGRQQVVTIPADREPATVVLDPDTWALAELAIGRRP